MRPQCRVVAKEAAQSRIVAMSTISGLLRCARNDGDKMAPQFKQINQRTLKQALLYTLLTLFLPPTHADAQTELHSHRHRLTTMQQELEKTTATKHDAADALRESERAISESSRRLGTLADQQHAAQNDLQQIQQRSAKLSAAMHEQQAQLSTLLYRQYLQGGRPDDWQLLFNDRSPEQIARNLRYYRYIARERNAWLAQLRSDLAQVENLAQQAHKKSGEISSLQQQEASQRDHLEQDKHARQQTLQKISMQLKQQSKEIDRLQRDEKRLSQLMEKLTRIIPPSDASGFAALKGRLLMPVNSKPNNRFGDARPDGQLVWKGWFFHVADGHPVKVIADGRVVFADWLRGFGNLLIVDHGKGYMSLYGYNEALYKQVGDTVKAGEVIATVGNSGGNDESGLYFELRHDGIPLDPLLWLAKR
jgi:septal ring factor EnvC (AmiA/AmiB activator)